MFYLQNDGSLIQVHEEVLTNPELNYHLECERLKLVEQGKGIYNVKASKNNNFIRFIKNCGGDYAKRIWDKITCSVKWQKKCKNYG